MLKDVVKAAALFFAVGAVLSLAAPVLAVTLGIETSIAAATDTLALTANPVWLGGFFALFGAIDAALRPGFDKLFGDDKAAEPAQVKMSGLEKGHAPAPAITQPEHGVEIVANHRSRVEAERAAPPAERLVAGS